MKKIIFLYLLVLGIPLPHVQAEVLTVNSGEEARWFRHVIPLPHEISIKKKIVLKSSDISIVCAQNAGDTEKNVVEELSQLFKTKTGGIPAGNEFTIVIGVVDEAGKLNGTSVDGVRRLESLPNSGQAYLMEPQGDAALLLVALDEKGVWNAAATLTQLIEPFMARDTVSIPLAEVTDWPDMNERGVWNFPSPKEWIPWMSSLKLNWGNMFITMEQIKRGKINRAPIDTLLLREGRLRGFNYLPEILHLNFLGPFGLYREYPELAGVGDGALAGRYFAHKKGDQHRAPCASNPLLTQIISEWMVDIASQGANEITCWLSERPAQCGCATCTAEGQFVWEARAFVGAWRKAQKSYSDLVIRLFISTTTDERYHKVLAETPPEVRIERCCATTFERVTHDPRDMFANPLFDDYAANGRWVATYDVPLTANGNVDTPEFKVPQSSAHRIKSYVKQKIERKWSAAYGMMAWGNAPVRKVIDPASTPRQGDKSDMARIICGFDINALAEWSWNLNGRSEKEFAAAWATREGYTDPEAFSEWSEIMGPIEFDVYDSDFPVCYSWGKAIAMVKARKRPVLGEGMFRYYSSFDDFDEKIVACDRAMEIARGLENPFFAYETAVVRSYIMLAKHLYLVGEKVATDDLAKLENQAALRKTLDGLGQAEKNNVSAIREWRSALGPEPWHYRVHDAIKGTEATVAEITDIITTNYFY